MMADRLPAETPSGVAGIRRKEVALMDYSNGEWRRTYYIYLYDPKSIDTPESVRTKDSYVQEDIARLEEALATLKQYRLELMERYRYLSETPVSTELVLRRDRGYRSAYVTYKLLLCKSYPDGTEHIEQISSHPGKNVSKPYPSTTPTANPTPAFLTGWTLRKLNGKSEKQKAPQFRS